MGRLDRKGKPAAFLKIHARERFSDAKGAAPQDSRIAAMLDTYYALVWVADPDARTVTVHGPDRVPRVLGVGDHLDGGEVLPGFRVAVAELLE